LAEDFKSLNGGLPIRGGWGYTRETACIIEKVDPLNDPLLPFDGVGVEYKFVEKRIYEELIVFRSKKDQLSGIEWKLKNQSLINFGDRYYDQLIFDITAFQSGDWEELKDEYIGPNGHLGPNFNEVAHEEKRQARMIVLEREFWFDITSFYKRT
jgi:hypothetical protein